jgi:hypothetical protein
VLPFDNANRKLSCHDRNAQAQEEFFALNCLPIHNNFLLSCALAFTALFGRADDKTQRIMDGPPRWLFHAPIEKSLKNAEPAGDFKGLVKFP